MHETWKWLFNILSTYFKFYFILFYWFLLSYFFFNQISCKNLLFILDDRFIKIGLNQIRDPFTFSSILQIINEQEPMSFQICWKTQMKLINLYLFHSVHLLFSLFDCLQVMVNLISGYHLSMNKVNFFFYLKCP